MLLFLFTILFSPSGASARDVEFVPGEVLVRYRPNLGANTQALRARSLGLSAIRELPARRTSLVRLPAGESVAAAVARIEKSPDIELVQPNYIYRISATVPNDTLYSSLWGLKNTGQTISVGALGPGTPDTSGNPGTSGRDMDLEIAWDKITNCNAITVAVVDTGVRYSHGDLAANMWAGGGGAPNHGWDVQNSDNDPADDNGHGTHVAGTIGAVGNNATGTTGVCWGVKIMAIKALDADGAGTSVTVAAGVDWAVANGAKVINMSLGAGASDATLLASLEAARIANVVVVTAAGNDGTNNDTTPVYPCNYRKANMVCVGALNQTYALASFSNFGVSSVDIAAPGVNIVSPWPFTFARTSDDFTTGWTITGSGTGWGALSLGNTKTLAVPNNWNGGSSKYANSVDEKAYKDFDMTGAYDKLLLDFGVLNNLGSAAGDSLRVYYKVGMTDPMTGGTLLDTFTGQTGSYYYMKSYNVTASCANATCAFGYRLTTDASVVDTGALILLFTLTKLTYANTGYNVIAGTSMAAPHVAGLAAMVWAYQTNYTALEVVAALKYGGDTTSSLNLKTTTGKAANAAGSLSYIQTPQGIALTKE